MVGIGLIVCSRLNCSASSSASALSDIGTKASPIGDRAGLVCSPMPSIPRAVPRSLGRVVLCIATLVASSALAQDCDLLTKHGIYNYSKTASESEQRSSYANWFCSHEFSSQEAAESFGASLGFPFKGLPVKLGFDSSSKNFSQWQRDFCASSARRESARTAFDEQLNTISDSVIKGVTACLTQKGLHMWLEFGSSGETFTIAATYNSDGPQKSATIKNISFEPAPKKCTPSLKFPARIDGSTTRWLCTRADIHKPVTVVANASNTIIGGGSLQVPALPQEVPPPKEAVLGNTVNTQCPPQRQIVRMGGQKPGCACGTDTIEVPPEVRTVAGERFTFFYDASYICRGQSIEGYPHLDGYVFWDRGTPTVVDRLPEICGQASAIFTRPGTYAVDLELSTTCLDVGGCRNSCKAKGKLSVIVK